MNGRLGSTSAAAGRVPLLLALTFLLAAASARVQGQTVDNCVHPKEPLEFDYCGNAVTATLPHMYLAEWRSFNAFDKAGKKAGSEKDPGKSFLPGVRYDLRLSEADFVIFADSATSWSVKEEAFNKQFAAIRVADRAQHPELHGALSESAQKTYRTILRDREKALIEEFDDLHARLAKDHAKALDKRIVVLYTQGSCMPVSAPRASSPCAMPDP